MKTNSPQYDSYGRMKYHPDYHENHRESWTYADEKYLIDNYVSAGPEAIALTLGRTIGVVMTRAYQLRKDGKMPKRPPGAKKARRLRKERAA